MGQTTIEWVRNSDGSIGHTVNPIRATDKRTGAVGHFCVKISPGCAHCYAERFQKRVHMHAFDPANRKKVRIYLDVEKLIEVLVRREPTTYFWEDMSDLFGAWVKDEWIDACVYTMLATPRHMHMLLTKRSDRMRMYFAKLALMKPEARVERLATSVRGLIKRAKLKDRFLAAIAGARTRDLHAWPPQRVRVGVSIENQTTADLRLPDLVRTSAWDRYISYEPALGAVTLKWAICTCHDKKEAFGAAGHGPQCVLSKVTIDRLITRAIIGGESGHGARPNYIGWTLSFFRQCDELGIAPFNKQLGAFPTFTPIGTREFEASPIKPIKIKLKSAKGGDPQEWPKTAPDGHGGLRTIDLTRRDWPD